MMGGGAFILLKSRPPGPESAKQAEIRLAGLPKILRIAGPGAKICSQGTGSTCNGCMEGDFRRIWLIRPEIATFCYLDHSFSCENGAVSCIRMQGKDYAGICSQIIYFDVHRVRLIFTCNVEFIPETVATNTLSARRFDRNIWPEQFWPDQVARDLHKQEMVSQCFTPVICKLRLLKII